MRPPDDVSLPPAEGGCCGMDVVAAVLMILSLGGAPTSSDDDSGVERTSSMIDVMRRWAERVAWDPRQR